MKTRDPDEEDSLIDGDALSSDADEDSPSLPKESLIDDSPLNDNDDRESGSAQHNLPPPPD